MARRGERRKRARSELKNISYEIFIGLLSIMSIVNIALEWFVKDHELQQILFVMNGIFSVIFLMLFLLFLRYLPMIAISEVKGVTPQADPHHPLGGAKHEEAVED